MQTAINQQPKRGPGAPKGNLNALKGGRSSAKFQLLAHVVMQHPEVVRTGAMASLVTRLLPEVIRADNANKRAAQERARQIIAPYQPERDADRLANLLLIALVDDQKQKGT